MKYTRRYNVEGRFSIQDTPIIVWFEYYEGGFPEKLDLLIYLEFAMSLTATYSDGCLNIVNKEDDQLTELFKNYLLVECKNIMRNFDIV